LVEDNKKKNSKVISSGEQHHVVKIPLWLELFTEKKIGKINAAVRVLNIFKQQTA